MSSSIVEEKKNKGQEEEEDEDTHEEEEEGEGEIDLDTASVGMESSSSLDGGGSMGSTSATSAVEIPDALPVEIDLKDPEAASILINFNGSVRGKWLGTVMSKATYEYERTGSFPPITKRFIDCEKGNKEKAQVRWEETLKWRAKMKANLFLRTSHKNFDIIKQGYPHYIHFTDKQGRPVYWERLGKIDMPLLKRGGITLQQLLYHYMVVSEFLWEYVCPDDSGRSITILDFQGIKLKHLTGDVMTFLRMANGFYGKHFPEKLAHLLVLNAPSVFNIMWRMVKGFIDPVTAKKIIVVKPKDVTKTLLEYIPKENIPIEYGGTCKFQLGSSPEEDMLRTLMKELNSR